MTKQSFFKDFPEKRELLSVKRTPGFVPFVNGHFHTPYSFSAFTDIEQAFQLAEAEAVQVLGINDFYTTDGYREFASNASKYKIFPLFNIEFMALQKDLQQTGIRVNDPANPGRTYLSGKGLTYPLVLADPQMRLLQMVQQESNVQTAQMVEKLNDLLAEINAGFSFTFDEMKARYAKNLLRERHIAKALRIAIDEKFKAPEEKKAFYLKLFSGKEVKSDFNHIATLENEIRNNLLKAGGKAFVAEDPKAFLSLEQVNDIIIKAGGIPCYPVLLDDAKGNFTDYERNWENLHDELTPKGIYCIELIPGRNTFATLKDFVTYFRSRNFVITFGTEHNTPQLDPMRVTCSGGIEMDASMEQTGYEGACIIAAHQYLIGKGEEGYLDAEGVAKMKRYDEFATLGDAVIRHFIGK
ncbi:MAG: hypothetical protein ACM3P1_00130 [Candidatus Saccharibacteria bacterium]